MDTQEPLRKNPDKAADATGDVVSEAVGETKDIASAVMEQAQGAANEIVKVKKVVTDKITSLAERAPEIGSQLTTKASAAAETMYRDGSAYMARKVETYPLAALLVAGVVGCALGYLLGSRQERQ